jgi:hypothetical protein
VSCDAHLRRTPPRYARFHVRPIPQHAHFSTGQICATFPVSRPRARGTAQNMLRQLAQQLVAPTCAGDSTSVYRFTTDSILPDIR